MSVFVFPSPCKSLGSIINKSPLESSNDVLIGINTGSFKWLFLDGNKLDTPNGFEKLIELIKTIKDIKRLYIDNLNTFKDRNQEIVEALRSNTAAFKNIKDLWVDKSIVDQVKTFIPEARTE